MTGIWASKRMALRTLAACEPMIAPSHPGRAETRPSPLAAPRVPVARSVLFFPPIALIQVPVPFLVVRVSQQVVELLPGVHPVQQSLLSPESLQLSQHGLDRLGRHTEGRDRKQDDAI